MSDTTRPARRASLPTLLAAAATLALFPSAAGPQEGGDDGQERPRLSERIGRDSGTQEIVDLFLEVEAKLGEIDSMLWSASAGERPLETPGDAGIGKLLDDARQRGQEVQQGIERILEIARQQGGGGGGSGQMWSPGQQQGSTPDARQESESQGAPGERLATPEAPDGQQPQGEQPGGEKPEPQGEEPGGEKPGDQQDQPGGDGDEPEGPQDSPGDQDQNQAGQLPDLEGVEKVPPGQEADRWGELPLRVREVFRAEGGGDLPARYRDWIDAYYRRLNRRR